MGTTVNPPPASSVDAAWMQFKSDEATIIGDQAAISSAQQQVAAANQQLTSANSQLTTDLPQALSSAQALRNAVDSFITNLQPPAAGSTTINPTGATTGGV